MEKKYYLFRNLFYIYLVVGLVSIFTLKQVHESTLLGTLTIWLIPILFGLTLFSGLNLFFKSSNNLLEFKKTKTLLFLFWVINPYIFLWLIILFIVESLPLFYFSLSLLFFTLLSTSLYKANWSGTKKLICIFIQVISGSLALIAIGYFLNFVSSPFNLLG